MPEYYSIESEKVETISKRIEELTRWLSVQSPSIEAAQKQLDEGSVEQVYWHFGYLCALRDIASMINRGLAD